MQQTPRCVFVCLWCVRYKQANSEPCSERVPVLHVGIHLRVRDWFVSSYMETKSLCHVLEQISLRPLRFHMWLTAAQLSRILNTQTHTHAWVWGMHKMAGIRITVFVCGDLDDNNSFKFQMKQHVDEFWCKRKLDERKNWADRRIRRRRRTFSTSEMAAQYKIGLLAQPPLLWPHQSEGSARKAKPSCVIMRTTKYHSLFCCTLEPHAS